MRGPSTFFPNSAVLRPHTPKLCGIFHCDKYAFEEKNNFVLASQSLGAHRQKSHFFENFVQQDENKGESKWCLMVHRFLPRGGGAHKHFFDRDACPRTNFNYPKI